MSGEPAPKWPPYDKLKIIPKEEYVDLRTLAQKNNIALSGVKKFDGSAEIIREIIGTLAALQEKFPAVRSKRYPLTLNLDTLLSAEDFALTYGKVINLNAAAFRDVNLLAAEYSKSVADGWFVRNTTWQAIIHHEFGHVVADSYKLNSMKISCEIMGLKPKELFPWLKKNLSEYAGSHLDGGEIMSEVFADISTGTPSEFSLKFYDKILALTR